jgi:DHA1 family multidrug resistance protein-like MFS transporter
MKPRKEMLSFFVVAFFFHMAASLAHSVTPTLFKQLSQPDYMFGLVLGSMQVTNFLFSPFWGKMSSRVSSRKVLLICCIGYALGQLFFAISTQGWQFTLARAFAGLFTGGVYVSLLTYAINVSVDERDRGRNLIVSATLQSVGSAFGFFVGGMLGEISVYVTMGAQVSILVVCALLFSFFCKDDAQVKQGDERQNVLQVLFKTNPFETLLQGRQFLTGAFTFLLIVAALQGLSQIVFDQSFNYYAIDQIGLSTGSNGAIKFAMGITTLVANSTVCSWIMNRTDKKKSLVWIMACAASTMLAILFVHALLPFLVMNVVLYAICCISLPLIQSLCAQAAKPGQSNLMMGFYNSVKSVGSIFGSIIAGFAYAFNPKLPFIVCVIAFSLAALCSAVYSMSVQANAARQSEAVNEK